MKIRMSEEESSQLSTICRQLKMESSDGKFYETDCANTEGIFRIIQSIPSKKAEPFKRWLAKVGYERVQEIEDPNSPPKERAPYTNSRDIPMIGLKKECEASPFARNLPMSGKIVEPMKIKILKF